jgi:predicted transcriptional regulator
VSDYKDYVTADRRLAILRFLSEENDFSLNESVLAVALEKIGHAVARDVVRSDLEFLRDIALIRLEKVMDRILVAKITQRGLDVATGKTIVSGVKRPAPEV